MAALVGPRFRTDQHHEVSHRTPQGRQQQFAFGVFRLGMRS
jgi:hypothetical protein